MLCTSSNLFKLALLSSGVDYVSLKKKPAKTKARAEPHGMATVSNDVARARSLSENHLLQITIWQLIMNGAAQAYRIVPISTGQNHPVGMVSMRKIAPKNYKVVAALSTKLVE